MKTIYKKKNNIIVIDTARSNTDAEIYMYVYMY